MVSVDEKDTPEFIFQNHHFDLVNLVDRGTHHEGMVDHTFARHLWGDDEVVKLTAKRGMVSKRVGFLVRIAVFDNDWDVYDVSGTNLVKTLKTISPQTTPV
jgi:hypothetical protein